MVEDGDVITIDYIGRELSTGEIFDLTSEDVAAEEGHDVENMDLGPMDVLIGAGHVIPGLEDALKEMENGDERDIEIASDDAFGERSSDNVETIAKREFDTYDVQPRRGLVVEIDGRRGKILSTSSGRVRVDFNHPLAGKDLKYEIEILDVLDDPAERVNAVLAYYGLDEVDDVETTFDDGELTVALPDDMQNEQLRSTLQDELELVKGVDSVRLE
jgi:FKBP-type peptidyl-prolyl cis-trans isomerase SlyD